MFGAFPALILRPMKDDEAQPGASSMTIQISFDGVEPPTGTVVGEDRAAVQFAGWLDLMQAIERLAGRRDPDVEPAIPARTPTELIQEALP